MAINYEVVVINVENTLLSGDNPEIPPALGAPCHVEAHLNVAKPQLQVDNFIKKAIVSRGALHSGGDRERVFPNKRKDQIEIVPSVIDQYSSTCLLHASSPVG